MVETDLLTCSCGARVRIPPGAAGRLFRCPRCKADIVPPAEPGPASPSGAVAAPPAASGQAAGKCPICQTAIAAHEHYVTCPKCDQVHHEECWREVGGCSTYGCEQAPALQKEEAAQQPLTAWGDMKACPACGEKIKSIALRCRYCGTDFNTVDPLTAADLRRNVFKDRDLQSLRTNTVVLFILAMTGCLAPLALLIGSIYFGTKWNDLPKAGPVHQILAYATVGLSALYTLLLILFAVVK